MISKFIIDTFGSSAPVVKYIITFIISMLPIVELRGAIPIGSLAFRIPWYWTYIVSVLGNLVPVPIVLLFVKRAIEWSKTKKHLSKVGNWLEKKAEKNTPRVQKYEVFGLMLFVAIPLPMTGAWTGALVAALTGMKFRYAMISIIGGVLIAGAIVTMICQGTLGFMSWLIK